MPKISSPVTAAFARGAGSDSCATPPARWVSCSTASASDSVQPAPLVPAKNGCWPVASPADPAVALAAEGDRVEVERAGALARDRYRLVAAVAPSQQRVRARRRRPSRRRRASRSPSASNASARNSSPGRSGGVGSDRQPAPSSTSSTAPSPSPSVPAAYHARSRARAHRGERPVRRRAQRRRQRVNLPRARHAAQRDAEIPKPWAPTARSSSDAPAPDAAIASRCTPVEIAEARDRNDRPRARVPIDHRP